MKERIPELLDAATEALGRAYAPYSKFPVGAALLTHSGDIYLGCNIEISSYGLTMCAERVAMFKAISDGAREFEFMAVAATTTSFCPPCGACRQVLMDFAPDLKLILLSSKGETREMTISELLPEAFAPSFLGVERRR